MSTLVMGTRGSPLALAQSRQVAAQLQTLHPDLQIKERVIRTTGDARQNASLPAIGGKGVFTLEIETALLNGEIDFAVHSLKDLPPEMADGLCLAAIPFRAAAADVLIFNPKIAAHSQLADLPPGARIGTSSLRRASLIKHARPDFLIEPIRGNVDTRLKKLAAENFDAIVLARAGLQRLQIEDELAPRLAELDVTRFVPAPGQGALAIQARADDENTLRILEALEDAATRAAIVAERTVVRALDAGCSTPLGAHAIADGGVLSLWASVLSIDGARRVDAHGKGLPERAADLGHSVAQKLLLQGAREILA